MQLLRIGTKTSLHGAEAQVSPVRYRNSICRGKITRDGYGTGKGQGTILKRILKKRLKEITTWKNNRHPERQLEEMRGHIEHLLS